MALVRDSVLYVRSQDVARLDGGRIAIGHDAASRARVESPPVAICFRKRSRDIPAPLPASAKVSA